MIDRIIQISSEFYNKFVEVYLPTYFSWLTEKLSGSNPFAMISGSILFFFVLAIYVWYRNRDA